MPTTLTPPDTKRCAPQNKTSDDVTQNYFHDVKINFQTMKIYFHDVKIDFQALKITFRRVA